MVPQAGSVGLIGRYHAVSASHGTFNGYVFTVNTNGTYTLTVNQGGTAAYTTSGQRQLTPQGRTVLAHGAAASSPAPGTARPYPPPAPPASTASP
jgi:hypothetical protein